MEEINENPDEKKVRLAKMYLEKLADMKGDDEGDEDEEKRSEDEDDGTDRVSKILQGQAFEQRSGRKMKFYSVSDSISKSTIDQSSISMKRGHQLSVTSVCVSEDEKFIYSVSKDCNVIKWELSTLTKLHTFKGHKKKRDHDGHTNHILASALSTDGKLLATGGLDKTIKVWNTTDNKLTDTFKGHRDIVTALTFRQGSHDLYSGSSDRSVKVWNCDNFSYVDTLYGHQSTITGISCLRRERCVTSSEDRSVRLWKIMDETQLLFKGPEESYECISLITEDLWVTGSMNGSLHLWSALKKKPICTIPSAHGKTEAAEADVNHWIACVAALPFSDIIATGSCDGNIKLWKVEGSKSLKHIKDIPLPGWVNSLSFSKSGKYLVAGVGQEHRLGRWTRIASAKNGVYLIKLLPEFNKN
eukprot:TRINITY_DN1801_c0_g1_i1.p1 TRINITY_DN1801_c0_g1~~TRINITY_DN1801_c0_g1_i1.p1  ORF type:complete len:485 (-),score=99.71 TRINITY_DN1801_c0_g1_i1:31-1275(-)